MEDGIFKEDQIFVRHLFNLGETVIDTRTHNTATVVSIIPQGQNSITDIYVLDDDGKLYLSDDTNLVVYDKYYWDELESRVND